VVIGDNALKPALAVVAPVPPLLTAIAVAFHAPVVIDPTDTRLVAVVSPERVVKVELDVADNTVAPCVPVTSPDKEPVKLPAVAALRLAT